MYSAEFLFKREINHFVSWLSQDAALKYELDSILVDSGERLFCSEARWLTRRAIGSAAKKYASRAIQDDWQAPSTYSHLISECSKRQLLLGLDDQHAYVRYGGAIGTDAYERHFRDEIFPIRDQITYQSILCNSGISAVSFAIESLFKLNPNIKRIATSSHAYFELQRAVGSYALEVIEIEEHSQVSDCIVLVEPEANSYSKDRAAFEKAVSEYCYGDETGNFLVVDKSTHVGTFSFSFERIAPFINRVVWVESLLKTCQYGLDLTQGGIASFPVSESTRPSLPEELRLIRALSGRTPLDYQVAVLPPPDRSLLDYRKSLVHQNSRAVIEVYRDILGQESVRENCSDSNVQNVISPLVTLSISSGTEDLFLNCVREFDAIGVPVSIGFSFGLNTTRFAKLRICDNQESDFYIRISPGTESYEETVLIHTRIAEAFKAEVGKSVA